MYVRGDNPYLATFYSDGYIGKLISDDHSAENHSGIWEYARCVVRALARRCSSPLRSARDRRPLEGRSGEADKVRRTTTWAPLWASRSAALYALTAYLALSGVGHVAIAALAGFYVSPLVGQPDCTPPRSPSSGPLL